MKKVLLSLLAVAALVLSCQNYDDEFDALNAKVASLEGQISSLAGLQAAITDVQTKVSTLASEIGSGSTGLKGQIAEILDDLTALATAVASATTQADLDALQAELNSTLAALKALVEANKTELDALGVDVDNILANNASFVGNVIITTAAQLTFAKTLGTKVKSIDGNVHIVLSEANKLTASDVAAVSSLIANVQGNVTIDSWKEAVNMSSLTAVDGNYTVTGWDASDDNLTSVSGQIALSYAFPYVFPKLTSAGTVFMEDNAKVAATTKVPAQTGVTSVDFLALTSATSIETESDIHTSGANITPSISTSTAAGVLSFASATSVKIGDVEVTALTAASALTVELHYDGKPSADHSITAGKATAVTTKADEGTGSGTKSLTVDQAATGTTTLTGKVWGGLVDTDGAVLSAAAATKFTGGITANTVKSLNLPLVASSGAISATSATSIVAPKLVVSANINLKDGTSDTPTSYELASVAHGNLTDLATIGSLKLYAHAATLDLSGAALLTSLNSTGKDKTGDITISEAEDALASLSFAGNHGDITIGTNGTDGLAKLTTFSTAGTVADLKVYHAKALTSIDMKHGANVAEGAALTIDGNDKLTSFTTSFDYAYTFVVNDNKTLASFDASSITAIPLDASSETFTFTVSDNYTADPGSTDLLANVKGLKGTYQAQGATVNEEFGQNSLMTLRPYLMVVKAAKASGKQLATATVNVSLGYRYASSATATANATLATIADVDHIVSE